MDKADKEQIRLILYPKFFKIAFEYFDRLREEEITLVNQKKNDSLYQKTGVLLGYNENHAIIVIVFSYMTIEALIYDYAEQKFGEDFVRRHLERKSVPAKWYTLVKSITGNPLPKGDKTLKMLANLARNRNRLTHFRSLIVENRVESIEKALQEYDLLQQAKQAFETVEQLLSEMNLIDPSADVVKQIKQ